MHWSPMSTPLADLLTPTAGAVTKDPRYQDLRSELDKLSSASDVSVDWALVARLAADLTREVGKDLNTLAFLALAHLRLRDLPALVAALRALAAVLLAPPPGPTPLKPSARAGAIEWLLTRMRAELPALPTPVSAAAQIHALHDAVRELGDGCRVALEELCPGFSTTLRVLDALRADLPQAGAPMAAVDPDPLPIVAVDRPEAAPTTEAAPVTEAASATVAGSDDPPAWRTTLAPFLIPLAGDPAGSDPAGSEAFDDARTEILKLGALSSQSVDWACVATKTDLQLREHSRDLRLAAWFTLASFHREGLAGLATGLHLLAGLLETFDLHPRKPKPRRDTVDWLVRQITSALAGLAGTELREEPLRAVEVAQLHLAAALEVRLGDDLPSLRPLRDALQQARERAPAPREARPPARPADPPVPEEPVPEDRHRPDRADPVLQPSAAIDLPQPPGAPVDLTRVDAFLDSTGDALQDVARTLREQAPTDPRAYRLLRIGVWLGRSAPMSRPDGTTTIPGLAQRDRDQLAELHTRAQWPGLLTLAENLLHRHCFALDLQRFAAAALAGLGRDYGPAGLAVRAELRALLTCLPGLLELRTDDGLPLADPATRRWIDDELLPRPGAAATIEPGLDPAFWAELPARLAGPERPEALAEAQAKIDAYPSGQLRFLGRLALADACERAGAVPLAALLLTGLDAELDRSGLAQWDPALAARCLAAAARCHRQSGGEGEARAALTRLARLDPAAAAALN